MRAGQFLLRAAMVAATAVAFLWPVVWNGGPFFFTDTRTYIRSADAAVNKLTHWRTVWTAPEQDAAPAVATATVPDPGLHNIGVARTRSLAEISKKGILLGRSPFYGLLLYLGVITGGFWLTMLAQAGCVLLVVGLALRALRLRLWPALPLLGLALCCVPATPMFACYLMPDLFAGIAILVGALLLTEHGTRPRADLLLCGLLLAASALFHDSCVLIVAALFGLGVLWNLLRRSWANWRGLGIILLTLVAAFLGQFVVAWGAKRASGEAPLRLPFLSARLVEDGPGTNYLRANCPASHFVLCDYVSEFPMKDAEFLFGTQPGRTVFETAPYEVRSALGREQFRFFFAVSRYDPVGVVKALGGGAVQQLFDFRMTSFNYEPSMRDVIDRTLPLPVIAGIQRSQAYRGTLPVTALSVWMYACVLGALAWLGFILFGRGRGAAMSGTLRGVLGWILVGIAVNAGVCGAFSAVDPRYQARVVWLIPLVALLAWVQSRGSAVQHRADL